jgi:hypothetical protein
LSEQRRTEVAHGIAKVHVVQDVLEVQRERQIVATTPASTWSTKTTATWSTTKAATAATTARTTATGSTLTSTSHAATHDRISLSITLLILPVLILILTIVGTRAALRTKTPRLTHAQVRCN